MTVRIAEVGIDPGGSLYVTPEDSVFPMIYRAAMQVSWDTHHERLFSPRPVEWTYRQWFKQILAAVFEEYGVRLSLTADTIWANLPDALRDEIRADT